MIYFLNFVLLNQFLYLQPNMQCKGLKIQNFYYFCPDWQQQLSNYRCKYEYYFEYQTETISFFIVRFRFDYFKENLPSNLKQYSKWATLGNLFFDVPYSK